MRRSAGSSKNINGNETPSTKRKSQKLLTSQKVKSPGIKENQSSSKKFSSYEENYYGQSNLRKAKIGSPKDSLDDITNLSLEASLSLASLKNYDFKLKNGNICPLVF